MTTSDDDLLGVVAVNAFGVAGVAVSLLDFLIGHNRPIIGLDPLGVAVFLLGLTIEISARRALGKHFSVKIRTTENQMLVQSGPYRFIRHPIYLGVILVYFSAAIAWESAYGALIILPIIPLLQRRIIIEEKVMALRFGDEYAAYAKKTKRLIPLVY